MLVDQTEVARQRHRRGRPRFVTLARVTILASAMTGVGVGAWWLKSEVPHAQVAEAVRESPLVEARSLKPLLETAQPSEMAAYGLKKSPNTEPAITPQPARSHSAPTQSALPVWLVADDAKSAELLRQSLRERGARQMGQSVRLAMLNLAELLAMDEKTWAADMKMASANDNHISALVLTFYLYHLDRAADGAGVTALRQALENGMSQDQAVREFILAGRSVAEIEREMGVAFASVGIELQFTRRGRAVFKP